MTQGIRPSQFVISYGPGAILETKNGPVIIPSPDIGLFHRRSRLSPKDYLVDTTINALMAEREKCDTGIFRIPTNSELGRLPDYALYGSAAFPEWRLCLHQSLHRNKLGGSIRGKVPGRFAGRIDILHRGDRCPVCTSSSGGKNATSFVSVCGDGHLDDVDWSYVVHNGSCKRGGGSYYLWIRKGGTLHDIDLVCPRCDEGQANFGRCFYAKWRCSGRFPEREQAGRPYRPLCRKTARIMQRQAASIRVPEVRTYLSIHPTYTGLDKLARATDLIKGAAALASKLDGGLAHDSNFKMFTTALQTAGVPHSTIAEFERAKRDEVVRVVKDLMAPPPKSHRDMLNREYEVLIRASRDGAPASPPDDDSAPLFEVCRMDVRRLTAGHRMQFTVVPIRTLETVTVQAGFRRIVPSGTRDGGSGGTARAEQPKLVKVDFMDAANRRWYPGISFLGEGLFITLEDGSPVDLSGQAEAAWRKIPEADDLYPRHLFRDPDFPGDELDPRFVWWHTLAHLLIRSISEQAGYSAAAIRERVYFAAGGRGAGGILLYATQPGTEGTMGGLVGLAPRLEQFMRGAEENALTCSADPLCRQGGFAPGRLSGSCCYGCLMNPETSCEHRNMWLDRAVVMENLP